MPAYTQYMWNAISHILPWGGRGHGFNKAAVFFYIYFLLHRLGVCLRELSICCVLCELSQELHCPQQGPCCCSSFLSLSEWRSLDPRYHPLQAPKAPKRLLVSRHRGQTDSYTWHAGCLCDIHWNIILTILKTISCSSYVFLWHNIKSQLHLSSKY